MDKIEILCAIENIRYYKDGWGIIEVSVESTISGSPIVDRYGSLILKGNMPKIEKGSESIYHVVATYVHDPKWGDQYEIQRMYSEVVFDDDDVGAQKRFLAALFTPRQINLLYENLQDPYHTIKEADAAALVQIKGIGMYTAMEMINKFKVNISLGRIFTELSEYNLTNRMVERLMSRYGSPDIIIEKVKEDPYVLADEVDGVGWVTADKIAQDGGITEYDPRRIAAYIRKYLHDVAESGQSWVTTDELLGAILDALGDGTPDQNITEAIQRIKDYLWYNDDHSRIGLKYYRQIEEKIGEELLRLRDAQSVINESEWENWQSDLRELETKQGWEFTQEQRNGIYLALSQNVVVITGMAGTGKSSLVTGILAVLKDYDYVQCALSGRAASRLSEITGREGYTIHRLLGYPSFSSLAKQGFTYHDDNPLTSDIYILDEISMVNSSLFYYLLRAIPSGSKLICLGDHGQLESIGAGNIAHDMIESDEIATVKLTQIHRQAAESGIISEAFRVRQGYQIVEKEWAGKEVRGALKDLTITGFSDASNTFYNIMAAYSAAMSKDNFSIMDTQILVPVKNRGAACTYEINNAIQELVNPADRRKNEVTVFSSGKTYILREGDKIINTFNNYKLSPVIYNGNIGQIRSISEVDEEIVADFIGIGEVTIPKEFWHGLELGYCSTIHKFQGSETDHVIIGIDFTGYSLLTRELVYTALTRAKKTCELIVQTGALRYATANEGVSKKQTHLKEVLYDLAHPKLIF